MLGHVGRWLSAYAEGVLPPAEAGRVARHLLVCRRCRRGLDQVRAGIALAGRLGAARAAGPAWSEIAPRLGPQARVSPPRRWAVAAAAAVILAGGGLLARRPHHALARAAGAPTAVEAAALAAHAARPLDLGTREPARLGEFARRVAGLDLALAPAPGVRFEGIGRTGDGVAVAARVGAQPVTLVVGPAEGVLAGRKQVTWRASGDLSVLSWTRGGQSYALVSSLPARGEAACTLCHARAVL